MNLCPALSEQGNDARRKRYREMEFLAREGLAMMGTRPHDVTTKWEHGLALVATATHRIYHHNIQHLIIFYPS